MAGFAYHRRSGQVIATFGSLEADVLRSMAAQLVELLHEEKPIADADEDPFAAMVNFNTQDVSEPEDPVLQRLLPNAYPDDGESSAEFRRFTEGGLRDTKAAAARQVVDALNDAGLSDPVEDISMVVDVELGFAEAMVWMRALNDMRLAVGTRLGVAEDDHERWEAMSDENPAAQTHYVYEWLGFLQETLVRAMGKV